MIDRRKGEWSGSEREREVKNEQKGVQREKEGILALWQRRGGKNALAKQEK